MIGPPESEQEESLITKADSRKILFWLLTCVLVVAIYFGMRQIYRIPTIRLTRAINQGDTRKVEQFTNRGHWVRPFSETELGIAALKAIESEQIDVLRMLLEMERCVLETRKLLAYSVLVGNIEVAKWLLGSDASIDLAEEIDIFETRYNLLTLAVAVQSHEIVELLLGCGADVNAYDKSGITALITAVSRQDTGVANVLLDAGADPNQPSSCDLRIYPLIYAVMKGNVNMVQLLIDRGAHLSSVSFKTDGGFIDIARAIAKSKNKEVKRFVESILEERSDQMTRVVVALNDLDAGHLISADLIATKVIPEDELPNDYIAIEYASAILGKYPKKKIPAMFPLRWSHMGFTGHPETTEKLRRD